MRYTRHLGRLGALMISLAACGGGDRSNTAATPESSGTAQPGSGGVHTERLVCPTCAPRAGGETSDFGDGSDYFPGGSGETPIPSPCELSQRSSAIDAEAARALGFGAALDAVATSFDLPFKWSPGEASALNGGGPAAGYTPETRLLGTTQVSTIELRSSTLEGCEDLIVATLSTRLATADGSLAISGELRSVLLPNGIRKASAGLELSQARGTLELDPPSAWKTTVGVVYVNVYFLSKGVRAVLSLEELDPDKLEINFSYYPLDGQAPIDACPTYMEPLDFEEPTAALGGASLSDRFPEFEAKLHTEEAVPARWRDGTETTIQLELGEPLDVCGSPQVGVSYQVPLQMTSSDGRVAVGGKAFGNATDSLEGWVDIYDPRIIPADMFAQSTGIQGVDFAGVGAGIWRTRVYSEEQPPIQSSGEAPYHGEVIVEGVDDDGHVPGLVTGVIEKLTW